MFSIVLEVVQPFKTEKRDTHQTVKRVLPEWDLNFWLETTDLNGLPSQILEHHGDTTCNLTKACLVAS